MGYERAIANTFSMTEAVWERHANPWSVWTRVATLPFLVVAAWSRIWVGWWSLPIFGILILWLWLNPRLFPIPESTDNWGSKAVFGERVWINKREIPIPEKHRFVPHLLNVISAVGSFVAIYGIVTLEIWPTLLGSTLIYSGKMWFLDRMVWLYDDMAPHHSEYRRWLRSAE